MTEPLLQAQAVEASYGDVRVLKGIDLEVGKAELVAIVGANGAGKTTVLRVLSGLVRPTAGQVRLDGERVTGARPHDMVERGVAHVPEGREVLGRLTVEENLRLGAYRRRDRAGVEADLTQMRERFPVLGQRRSQRAGTLSGGEQQQLAIARALMSRPRLLLLDEPSLGLAPVLVERVFDMIGELKADGLTMLLVEQNTHQTMRVADRVYVQETGTIVLDGTAAEVRDDARLGAAYLGGGVSNGS